MKEREREGLAKVGLILLPFAAVLISKNPELCYPVLIPFEALWVLAVINFLGKNKK